MKNEMLVLELIGEFIAEEIIIGFFGGGLSRINNVVLKLRGIETRSVEEIKLNKIKKRYELKWVRMKKNANEIEKGSKGGVLEIIDVNSCLVEFGKNHVKVKEIKIKDLLICRSERLKPMKSIDH